MHEELAPKSRIKHDNGHTYISKSLRLASSLHSIASSLPQETTITNDTDCSSVFPPDTSANDILTQKEISFQLKLIWFPVRCNFVQTHIPSGLGWITKTFFDNGTLAINKSDT